MIMKTAFAVLIVVSLGSFASLGYAASDTVHIELGVYHCDNDSICEVAENAEFCPLDCIATTTPEEPEPEEEEDSTPPSQGPRVIEQLIDLFQTYIPFIGDLTEQSINSIDEPGYVCTDGACTTFTEDLARSVVVSFEEASEGGGGATVSVSPISGEEIAFVWEEGMTMRIMRSPEEFPIDSLSGELVYEGARGEFTAFGVLDSDIMYYSLFPKYEDGSYGDPEFIIVKSQSVSDGKKATSTLMTLTVGTFFVAILGFIGRFIFLLI